jgi:hypothetical protein
MQPANSQRKLITTIAIIFGAVVIASIIIAIIVQLSPKNEYGERIKIQNYTQKVKNVSDELHNATEAGLYNTVKKNVPESTNPSKIKDAFIRDNSNSQDYDKGNETYNGKFIVDIESIKQSYLIQYTYVKNDNSDEGLATRVVVSCVNKEDVKYESFKCDDFVKQQATQNDNIIQYLPYSNFSFKIAADTTAGDDKMILLVELRIPESDLKGDVASKQAVVAMYKNEVAKWLETKNLDPTIYTYEYNYDDNGNLLPETHDQHGDSDGE